MKQYQFPRTDPFPDFLGLEPGLGLGLALLAVCAVLAPGRLAADAAAFRDPLSWAAPTQTTKPWARWWWMGSAVDKTNLTHQLEVFQQAGLGGVEICPIYGARGYEVRFIDFLAPQWMDMLAHTVSEAKRLGLGVDLTTGTGWPNGGPRVTTELASGSAVIKRFDAASFASAIPRGGRLQTLRAFGTKGTTDARPFESPIANYYMTDPISRASATMAQCTEAFVSPNKKTGTNG